MKPMHVLSVAALAAVSLTVAVRAGGDKIAFPETYAKGVLYTTGGTRRSVIAMRTRSEGCADSNRGSARTTRRPRTNGIERTTCSALSCWPLVFADPRSPSSRSPCPSGTAKSSVGSGEDLGIGSTVTVIAVAVTSTRAT